MRILEQIELLGGRERDWHLSGWYIAKRTYWLPYRASANDGQTYQWHRPWVFEERRKAKSETNARWLKRAGDTEIVGNTHAYYLRDLGYELRALADDAIRDAESAAPGEARDLHQGRKLAYYEVISLMHQQAEAFGLPLNDLALEGIDPERHFFGEPSEE